MYKILLVSLFVSLFFIQPLQAQDDLQIQLVTSPSATQIGPDDTLATATISIVDGTGNPVPNTYLKMHLDAPKGNAFFSTDFPIVEGTPLMEFEGQLPDGTLEFDYIYPIRGTYAFNMQAGRSAGELTFADTLSISISENGNEVRNFVIFAAILLLFGLFAGYIIGGGAISGGARSHAATMAAVSIVAILGTVAGLFVWNLAPVSAHGGDSPSETEPFVDEVSQNGLTLRYAMSAGSGRVGSLNALDFSLTDANDAPVADTTFALNLWHIEDEKPVFSMQLPAPSGETQLMFQFFDGAEHEVRVEAGSPQGNVNLARVVEVEGINPPMAVKIKTTVYLVLITLLGMLLGMRIRFRKLQKGQLALSPA